MTVKTKKKLYFLIGETGVESVFVSTDERSALKVAVEKGDSYTAVPVTSKNWKRIAEQFGEVLEGARDRQESQDQLIQAFTRMGKSPSEALEAARGRDLDPRATLNALGLSEADFRDFDDFEDNHEPLSEESGEMTDEQANEYLRKAQMKLGLSEADLQEFNSLP